MELPKRKQSPLPIRLFRILLPQIILVSLLISYLLGSSFIFRYLDEDLRKHSIYQVFLFAFGTVTTIGYGDLSPSTDEARLFCILFSLIGIPITLLTLANFGKHVGGAFWYLIDLMKICPNRVNMCDTSLPLPIILLLFGLTFLFCSSGIDHTGQSNSLDDVYFSFISFATVGFGDQTPIIKDLRSLIVTTLYLTWGIMLTTALFSHLNRHFQKVHYFGRRFTGSRDVPISIGGKQITVSKLMQTVATEFEASPREVREMLRDLDEIISSSLEESKLEVPLVKEIEDFDCFE